MASVAKFDTWQASDGTNVARFNAGALEVWDGSAWGPTGAIGFNFLVIAGGGGGGVGDGRGRGGGGAGGYRNSVSGESSGGTATAESPLGFLNGDSFTVTIGAGGASTAAGSITECGPIVSVGGGCGADNQGNLDLRGGSGGGGHGAYGNAIQKQGFRGGIAASSPGYGGSGGGGAGETGFANVTTTAGDGGDGLSSSITGTGVYRGGGGGGGSTSTSGQGGLGGGGAGGSAGGTSGTVNTGGGGGGTGNGGTAGSGGSGIVILKYPDSVTLTIGAGLTSSTSTAGGFKVTQFTAGTDTVTVG